MLINELGRARSNEDGVALAWAVSENLIKSNALTLSIKLIKVLVIKKKKKTK